MPQYLSDSLKDMDRSKQLNIDSVDEPNMDRINPTLVIELPEVNPSLSEVGNTDETYGEDENNIFTKDEFNKSLEAYENENIRFDNVIDNGLDDVDALADIGDTIDQVDEDNAPTLQIATESIYDRLGLKNHLVINIDDLYNRGNKRYTAIVKESIAESVRETILKIIEWIKAQAHKVFELIKNVFNRKNKILSDKLDKIKGNPQLPHTNVSNESYSVSTENNKEYRQAYFYDPYFTSAFIKGTLYMDSWRDTSTLTVPNEINYKSIIHVFEGIDRQELPFNMSENRFDKDKEDLVLKNLNVSNLNSNKDPNTTRIYYMNKDECKEMLSFLKEFEQKLVKFTKEKLSYIDEINAKIKNLSVSDTKQFVHSNVENSLAPEYRTRLRLIKAISQLWYEALREGYVYVEKSIHNLTLVEKV